MANVPTWSTTAGSNSSAAPDGFPEGMAPSGVNDAAREVMAAVARWYKDQQGTLLTAGTSTAYTLTTNTTYTALSQLPLLVFEAHTACGAAPTLNVDSLGAKPLRKRNGQALEAGDIAANQRCVVIYNADDDTFELVQPPLVEVLPERIGKLAPAENLVVTTGTAAASQITVTADELIVSDGTSARRLSSVSVADIDITASGAGGLDTGAEAASTWYYIWVIWNGSTVSGLLSTSATAPTMPSGYTHKALVGAVYNDASSSFIGFHQRGGSVAITRTDAILVGTATTRTAVSLSAIVPPEATEVGGDVEIQDTAAAVAQVTLNTQASGSVGQLRVQNPGGSANVFRVPFALQLVESQKLYYHVAGSGDETSIRISSWRW